MIGGKQKYQNWLNDCFKSYELAVKEAEDHWWVVYHAEKQKQLLLLNCLEPYWDEFVPLFDTEYNPILRSFNEY